MKQKQLRTPQPRREKTSPPFSKANAVLFFLFSLALPTQLAKHFFLPFSYVTGVRVDYLAPSVGLLDIAALILICVNMPSFRPLLRRKKLIIITGAALLLNFAFAISKPLFVIGLVRLLEAAAVAYLAATQYGTYKRQILGGLAAATLLQFPLVVSQLVFKHSLQGVWYFLGERLYSPSTPGIAKAFLHGVELVRPYGTFSHPNSLAGFFLLVELFFLVNRDITNAVFRYTVVFVASFLVMVSFSKNAILAYLIFNLLFAVRTKRCRLCLAAAALTSIVTALLFFQATTDAFSFDKRITLMTQSLAIIMKYPLFGTGIGSYLLAQAAFPIKYPYFFLQPVHNIILLAVAELGVPISFLLFFQTVRFVRQHLMFTFLILAGAVFLTGMADHYWLTLQQNLLLAAYLMGAVVYNKQHEEKTRT